MLGPDEEEVIEICGYVKVKSSDYQALLKRSGQKAIFLDELAGEAKTKQSVQANMYIDGSNTIAIQHVLG